MKRLLMLCGIIAAFFTFDANATMASGVIGSMSMIYGNTTLPVQSVAKVGAATALQSFRSMPPALAAAVTVGAMFAYMELSDNSAQHVQVLTGAGTLPAQPKPDGWSTADSPPSTTAVVSLYRASTTASCCSAWTSGPTACANYDTQYVGQPWVPTIFQSDGCHRNTDGSLATGLYVTQGCQNGYTLSGSNCVISNPASVQWPSDGVPSYMPNPIGNGLVLNPRDPDSNNLTPPPNYSRLGVDGANNPVAEQVVPNATHGIDYTRDTESVDQTTGQPNVTRQKISTDSNGNVINRSEVVYNNSTVSNVNTSNITNNTTDLTATNLKLDTLVAQTKTSDAVLPTVPSVRSFTDSTNVVVNAFKSNLVLPTFNDSGALCPTFDQYIPFINVTLHINAWCDLEPYIGPILDVAMTMFWLILGFYIVARA